MTQGSGGFRQAAFWLGAFALFFLMLYLLSGILLPFVAGMAIAYLLSPLVSFMTARGMSRGAAAFLTLLLFLLILGVVVLLLVPVLQLQATELARHGPDVVRQAREWIHHLTDIAQQQLAPDDLAKARQMVDGWTSSAVVWVIGLAEGLLSSGLAIANLLSLLIVTPLVAFFMLRDWERIIATIDLWLPRPQADTIRQQARLVDETLAGYVHGQLILSLLLGFYYAIALTIVGLDFSFIFGLLVGLLSIIPYIGELIGLVLAGGVAALQFGSLTKVAIIGAIFLAGHLTEGNLLQPKLIGGRIHLHPLWVVFALLAFGSLFGFLGILLALPAAAVIGVLARFAVHRYLASSFYDPGGGWS